MTPSLAFMFDTSRVPPKLLPPYIVSTLLPFAFILLSGTLPLLFEPTNTVLGLSPLSSIFVYTVTSEEYPPPYIVSTDEPFIKTLVSFDTATFPPP